MRFQNEILFELSNIFNFEMFCFLKDDDCLIAYNYRSIFSPRVQNIFYFLEESDAPKCERKHNTKLGSNDKEFFVHFYAY